MLNGLQRETVCAQTSVQNRVFHLVRDSLRLYSYKDHKDLIAG